MTIDTMTLSRKLRELCDEARSLRTSDDPEQARQATALLYAFDEMVREAEDLEDALYTRLSEATETLMAIEGVVDDLDLDCPAPYDVLAHVKGLAAAYKALVAAHEPPVESYRPTPTKS